MSFATVTAELIAFLQTYAYEVYDGPAEDMLIDAEPAALVVCVAHDRTEFVEVDVATYENTHIVRVDIVTRNYGTQAATQSLAREQVAAFLQTLARGGYHRFQTLDRMDNTGQAGTQVYRFVLHIEETESYEN